MTNLLYGILIILVVFWLLILLRNSWEQTNNIKKELEALKMEEKKNSNRN